MSLTESGTQYHAQVSRLLDELAEAERGLRAIQDVPRGTLRVSAPLTLTMARLARAIPAFLKRYPEVSLQLQLEDRRVDIVRDGYDLAIRGSDQLEDSSLVARKLMTMPHVVCGAPAYFARRGLPRAPADLRHHECVQFTLSGHADQWTFRKGRRSATVPIDGRYKVTSSLAVREALLDGFGLSLIPRLYVRQDLAAGRLRTVLDDWSAVEASIYAVYPSSRHLVAKVRAFVDFLVEELATRPGQPSNYR